jgi:two-component system OmpR family sensor kinase
MAYNTQRASFWESLRQLPQRMSLRAKLVVAALALAAVALAVISVAGLSFLRTYLIGQADSQLDSLAVQARGYNGHLPPRNSFSPEAWTVIFVPARRGAASGSVDGNLQGASGGPLVTPGASWLTSGAHTTVSAQSGSDRWRVLAVQHVTLLTGAGPESGTLVFGIDVTDQYATLTKLTTVDIVVSVLILLAMVAASTAVVRASLRPLTDIEKTAGAIAAGDLTRRVPELDPRTEVGRLGRSLNVMLSQIETAFDASSRSEEAARRSEGRMRQFVADASHELRTPLTAIRGFAEYYRQRGGVQSAGSPAADSSEGAPAGSKGTSKLTPADLDRIMRRVEQESARMGILVEDMLLLARLDQQRPLDNSTVDLLTLAADAVHDARVVAPSRNINLTVGAGAALLVNGDEVRLRQVIGNLMSNALAHTPDGSPIDVRIRSGSLAEIQAATASAGPAPAGPPAAGASATAAGAVPLTPDAGPVPSNGQVAAAGPAAAQSAAVLEVTDHGPGLSEEQAAHAFERFYRADAARTTGGTGLGLAIVAALVSAHGGAVWVRTQPGQGATFAIALPLTPEAVREAGQDDEHDELADEGEVLGEAPEVDWIDSHTGRGGP